MTSKEFIERLKSNDLIYKTDEEGNVVMTKTTGEIFEYHFKKLEEDLEELEQYRNEEYKHWNIFFNAKKIEYLLYLEQKGKESFKTSISEELYSKIKEHFGKEKLYEQTRAKD